MNRRNRRLLLPRLAASWLILFLFYYWFICKSQVQQLVAGGIIGLAAALAVAVLISVADLKFTFRPGWIGLLLLRLPAKIARDLGVVAIALWRAVVHGTRPSGRFRELPFSTGTRGREAEEMGHRALVLAGVSIPPNTFAIGADSRRGVLLVHELLAQPGPPKDKEWPL